MPDDKFTKFLLALITDEKGLLKRYAADPEGVVETTDLTYEVKEAFAALPKKNALRFQIQNTQGFKGGGAAKKAASKNAAAKAAPAKKVAKGGKKR